MLQFILMLSGAMLWTAIVAGVGFAILYKFFNKE